MTAGRRAAAVLAAAAAASLLAAACGQPPAAPPSPPDAGAVAIGRFALEGGGALDYLWLKPADWGRAAPPRFRVYVVPGSGCRGLAPIARAYFSALRDGEVVVAHKRHVSAGQWPEPAPGCPADFIREDSLARSAADAGAFIDWHWGAHPPAPGQPVALVGISEGAELLAAVAARHPRLALLGLVGGTGLDPLEALSMQAARQGAPGFVAQMEEKARNPGLSDGEVWAGRSMGYWRGLRAWRHSEQLLGLPQPLWLGFGGRDASVPLAGLDLFVQRAHARGRPLCLALFPDSDHGLSRGGRDDDLQQYWRWLASALQRGASPGDCAPISPAPPSLRPGR